MSLTHGDPPIMRRFRTFAEEAAFVKARIAQAQDLGEIAARFMRALQRETHDEDAHAQLELKGWMDGLWQAFHYRYRFYDQWITLAERIVEVVDHAKNAASAVRSRESTELDELAHQLRTSLTNSKEGGN